jgi:hypothetical protein
MLCHSSLRSVSVSPTFLAGKAQRQKNQLLDYHYYHYLDVDSLIPLYLYVPHRLMWHFLKADFGVDDTLDPASTRRLYTPSPEVGVESSSAVLMQVAVTAAAAELPLVLKKLDEMVNELSALRASQEEQQRLSELMANELAQLKQQQRAFGCPDSAQQMCRAPEIADLTTHLRKRERGSGSGAGSGGE